MESDSSSEGDDMSSSESVSSSENTAGSQEQEEQTAVENLKNGTAIPTVDLELQSNVSGEEEVELDWDTAGRPPIEHESKVRVRRERQVPEWEGLDATDIIVMSGRQGFNRHINGIYRRQDADVYKKDSDVDQIYLFQTERWWRLSPTLDCEYSYGYTRNDGKVAPNRVIYPWKIFCENGTFEEDLNIRVRSLPDAQMAENCVVERKQKLSDREKALVTTLAHRGKSAKTIATMLHMNEEACQVMVSATAHRCHRRDVDPTELDDSTQASIAQALLAPDVQKTEDEVAFALRTRLSPFEKQRVCHYILGPSDNSTWSGEEDPTSGMIATVSAESDADAIRAAASPESTAAGEAAASLPSGPQSASVA
eukprot:GEMP01040587.1.p1 GENE.GEMP01040587.1~~GEMP01040587.1.p1  ORF type:complete len:367 (+),score=77.07 GEMP01040587.1:51-1151(+)